jgi:hypothetical protein
MEFPLQMVMAAERLRPVARSAQHSPGLFRQSSHCGARRYVPASRHLVSDAPHRAPRDARHRLQQVPRRWVVVERARDLPDGLGQVRHGLVDRMSNLGGLGQFGYVARLGQSLRQLGCFGHHREDLAGSHVSQRREVLGRLIFALRLCRQFAQMFHHGVGIDLADRTDLVLSLILVFILALVFVFGLPEQAAGDVSQSAKPAFTFQASLVLQFQFAFQLVLEFAFGLVFEFCFELIFEFCFQFTFECHDESSCEKWSNLSG